MTTMESNTPNYSRRIGWFAVFIVLLFAGYSAGWYYLADRLVSRANEEIANINRDGVTLECENPIARGYPFRLGIYCDSVAYSEPAQNVDVSAGNLRTAGQIYDPSHFIAELDGPAVLVTPEIGPLQLNWEKLRGSVRWARPLPERISIESNNLVASTQDGAALATVSELETHMRPNGTDLDFASSFSGLLFDASLLGTAVLPALAGSYDFTIIDGIDLRGVRQEDLRGRSFIVRDVSLSVGPTSGMTAQGSLSVDENGLIDADLKLTLRDPQGLSRVLEEMFPDRRRDIRNVSSALSLMGNNPTLPLSVEKGEARIAFFKVGRIPPL